MKFRVPNLGLVDYLHCCFKVVIERDWCFYIRSRSRRGRLVTELHSELYDEKVGDFAKEHVPVLCVPRPCLIMIYAEIFIALPEALFY